MTGRLSKAQRERLKDVVTRCRRELLDDLARTLEGRFGIRRNGEMEATSRLRLDDAGLATWHDLFDILMHFQNEGDTGWERYQRLLRETVFTHLNRLLAIRVAEAAGLMPESIARGRDSAGFRDVKADVAPQLGADDTGGYWAYLCLCGDELAADAPALFDPRNPLLAIAPTPAALDSVVEHLAPPYEDDESPSLWLAVDTLGWAYQFSNDDAERKKMRETTAPQTSRELAVRNQFFTPDYVVTYLVQNSLGRRLVEADPASGLTSDLDWLVDPPTRPGQPLALTEVRVLDPACGSGHFLLGAYDVLEAAWARNGVPAAEAAASILPTLWGIDIDPRAVQVAAAALVLRARRSCGRTRPLPQPNIICARSLPPIPPDLEASLPRDHRQLLRELRAELERAPVLGSLLKVEDVLSEGRIAGTLPGRYRNTEPLAVTEQGAEEQAGLRAEVLEFVRQAADATTSSAGARLTAAEAGDALRFVEAMSQHYDVVLMNPPFGEPVAGTKDYIRAAYPWIPTKDHNLLAAFVGRGLELCSQDGYMGAITSRTGMFITTFERWRTEVLLSHQMITLADLGFGVMEEALVEAAAFVLGSRHPDPKEAATFFRLLRTPAVQRPAALENAIRHAAASVPDGRVFSVPEAAFEAIPGKSLAYWMPESIRRLFVDLPRLEGYGAEVRVGLQTGDDFRFVRTYWEIDPRRIARSREETLASKRWAPFAKGGEYSPFWADIHLVVEYENNGERVRGYSGSRPQNTQYFFRQGITWPERTTSGFGPRVLPAGCIFSQVGYGAFPLGDRATTLGVMCSRLFRTLLGAFLAAGEETTSGTAAKHYTVGSVQETPWIGKQLHEPDAGKSTLQLATLIQDESQSDEISRRFVAPIYFHKAATVQKAAADSIFAHEQATLLAVSLASEVDLAVDAACGLDDAGHRYLEEEWGPRITSYPKRFLSPAEVEEFVGLYQAPINTMIDNLTASRGASKTVAIQNHIMDRRLEILAHAFARHPAVLVATRRQLNLLPFHTIRDVTDRILSYLVGCVVGRWDVRIGREPSTAQLSQNVFDAPPPCAPGMLVGLDGFPPLEPETPYPLSIPSLGLLVDEPGHRLDIVDAITAATSVLVDDGSALVHEISTILGRDLRAHLRQQFFKDHLGRYTKSRRKAPIYWPLTVPSRSWGVWLYAPRVTRETLFAVEAAADQRLGAATVEIRRLESQLLETSGRPDRDAARRLEGERTLAEELRVFHKEAARIAALGWAPDLDDGIVLCAAPLADLFPDWATELTAKRREIREGRYPWASVSRVREAL